MADARIRFAPDILRRLGEELNPSIDQGLVELAKNAYDADAHYCEIELIDTDQPGGSIRVHDDGRGMTADDIAHGFLVVGRSRKPAGRKTPGGRIPAGSKGLGRLAALRLGRFVDLLSRPQSDPAKQLRLQIDWDNYREASLVDDVALTIRSSKRPTRAKAGTIIEVSALTRAVGRMEVKRLARSLVLLADPFSDQPHSFVPRLSAPDFEDLEELVKRRYFDDAEYHLVAELNRNGKAKAQVVDWRGKILFEAPHEVIAAGRSGATYSGPPARFDLWIFLLTREVFKMRDVSVREVREWLEQFGGVHLYLNDLRVAPYGNPGDDWLDLNLRRAQSPEERPSTNTSIGRISVADPAGRLLQKTDRSGIVEDETFLDLREFAQDATEWMAKERLRVAERRRNQERQVSITGATRARQTVQRAIDKAPPRSRKNLDSAFRRYDRARDREAGALRREVQLYRTLSTAGITAATFAHEAAGSPVKVIGQAINAIERRAKTALGDTYESTFQRPIESARRALRSISVLSSATLRLIDHEKRRVGRVDVHAVTHDVIDTFEPFLDGRDVKVHLEFVDADPYLRAAPAALESVVTNLLNNSLAAFERSGVRNREILIATELIGSTLLFRVLDNGPGIDGVDIRDIWTPGVTTQPNGTGLGLTIVRDAVTDMGGSVEAVAVGELGGAEIRVELPLVGW
jgi:signal transduction histidine kinase